MRSADRVPLNWKRPPEWDRFLQTVEENHEATALYAGFEIERAWTEYREKHPAEEYVSRLEQAAGTRGEDTREKNPPTRASDSGGSRVGVRVREGVKEDMAAYAKETGVPTYEILRAVVCWYLDGGLLGRLTEKLGRAVPEAEDQLSALNESEDASLGTVERRAVELARRLTDDTQVFDRDNFRKELESLHGISDSPHCRDKYLPRVLDRLNYTTHPDNRDVFVPKERAREIGGDKYLDRPAIDDFPYADLSDEERVHGLRIEAVRKAEGRTNVRAALHVEEVRREVFESGPSKRKAKALMDRAAQASGFSTDAEVGKKRLKVSLREVDHRLLSDAGLDRDDEADSEGPDDGVKERMDVVTDENNHAVTDGGREDS